VNYLAHLYLSGDHPEWMVGGLLGDFVKGPLKGVLPDRVEAGIALHRRIDAFTDRQPEVQSAIARFDRPFRRYGGILVDLCYDHFLAANWHHFHSSALDTYCQRFYAILADFPETLPPGARRFRDVAPEVNWLQSYAEFERMEVMLARIGQRFRRPAPLHEAFPLLSRDYSLLREEFHRVFPRLIEFAENQRLESCTP